MKAYAQKRSAVRAAKAAGLQTEGMDFRTIEVPGGFSFEAIVAEMVQSEVDAIFEAAQQQAEQQFEAQTEAEHVEKAGVEFKHKSDIERPTKAVWHVAEEMHAANPAVRRKEVIAECVRRGIATGTARTQYQQWFQSRKA